MKETSASCAYILWKDRSTFKLHAPMVVVRLERDYTLDTKLAPNHRTHLSPRRRVVRVEPGKVSQAVR